MTSFVCRAKVGGSGNKPQSMYSALYYCCTVRSIATITPTFQRDFFTLFCSLGNSYCSTQKMDYTLFSVSKGDGIPYSIEQTQKPDYNCLNWPVIDRCMEGGGATRKLWRGRGAKDPCPILSLLPLEGRMDYFLPAPALLVFLFFPFSFFMQRPILGLMLWAGREGGQVEWKYGEKRRRVCLATLCTCL